jgi:hypothetical protein
MSCRTPRKPRTPRLLVGQTFLSDKHGTDKNVCSTDSLAEDGGSVSCAPRFPDPAARPKKNENELQNAQKAQNPQYAICNLLMHTILGNRRIRRRKPKRTSERSEPSVSSGQRASQPLVRGAPTPNQLRGKGTPQQHRALRRTADGFPAVGRLRTTDGLAVDCGLRTVVPRVGRGRA